MPSNKDKIEVFKKLRVGDFKVTPFEVNKSYSFNQGTPTSSGYFISECEFPPQGIYRKDIPPVGASNYNIEKNLNGSDKYVSWFSLRHNYYQGSSDWDYNVSTNNNIYTQRILHKNAKIISIPQKKFGNMIQKGSLYISDYHTDYDIILRDDSNSNIYDTTISNESLISTENLLFYYGFNDKFSNKNLTDINRNLCLDTSIYRNNGIIYGDLKFSEGIYTHGTYISRSGYMANFNISSSIQIQNRNHININNSEDFSLSFWIDLPNNQLDITSDKNYIISKRVKDKKYIYNALENRHDILESVEYDKAYPFDIFVYNSNSPNNGKIGFSRYAGSGETTITSSENLLGQQHHILFQKSGSSVELYIDGVLDIQTKDYSNSTTYNHSDIYIGSLGNIGLYLSGSIDEVRMYNKSLSPTEIGYLYNNDYNTGSAYQTNIVGNIFYRNGIVVISDPRPKYKNIFSGENFNNGYTINYNATMNLNEHEMTCKVNMGDFNVSMNPTTLIDPYKNDGIVKDFVSQDTFTPYITTVGFYDDNYELLAIGKFARPIKKRHDVDIILICRFDI